MLVRIRLRRGPTVRAKKRKNRHVALASAALLTPSAVTAFVLSMWRLGNDLGLTRTFAIQSGLLSHWQVWLAISVAIQFVAVSLNRYGTSETVVPDSQTSDKKEQAEDESFAVAGPQRR